MKKKLSAFAAALLMLLSLTACNKDEAGKGTAAGDTAAAALSAVIIARDDVPEEDVYALTAAIFENRDALAKQHDKGGELDLDFASSVTSVPYHPGAARYFTEKGKTVAAIKDGAGTGSSRALAFGTGGDTGTYYGLGGVLADHIAGSTSVAVTALTSGGSLANMEDLSADSVQLALVQSDVMSYAYKGERLFDAPVTGFSVVAALYQEPVQIVTVNPDIKSVADLAGKKVAIGVSGSGVFFNAVDILSAYGINAVSGISPVYQSFGESAGSLKDGGIDAAFLVAGVPVKAVADLAADKPVYLVGLDESHVNGLSASFPYFSACTIKDGSY